MCDDKSLFREGEAREGEAQRLQAEDPFIYGEARVFVVSVDLVGPEGALEPIVIFDEIGRIVHSKGRIPDYRHQLDRGGDDAAR